jgi:hypothetical protein
MSYLKSGLIPNPPAPIPESSAHRFRQQMLKLISYCRQNPGVLFFLMGTGGWLMLIEIIILFGFLVVFTVKMGRELQRRRRLHQI